MGTSIVWFRNDLRLDDHPALAAACKRGSSVAAVYIYDESCEIKGAASKWWLHHSLESLQKELKEEGVHLVIRKGTFLKELKALAQEMGADAIYYHLNYGPHEKELEETLHKGLAQVQCTLYPCVGSVFFEPGTILNKQGNPYQVFTPFYKACLKEGISEPLSKPSIKKVYNKKVSSLSIDDLKLLPSTPWDKGFYQVWEVGEKAAQKKLKRFASKNLTTYAKERDFPGKDATSRLSPHLSFGEISPRRIWKQVTASSDKHSEGYLRQLLWREFAYHLLHHFPYTVTKPLKEEFTKFKWSSSSKNLRAWQKGVTGYPIIDAALKQLWTEGWMHNRLRMIVGSFLVKDLRISWVEGAHWFFDTLVDADLANNTLGWQWVAGCGADAAPYFRVFNPVLQGEKFDPKGEFVKKYLPQLAQLPEKWIHKPWEAPQEVLFEAGITLGKDYPHPLVVHAQAKEEALKVYRALKKK